MKMDYKVTNIPINAGVKVTVIGDSVEECRQKLIESLLSLVDELKVSKSKKEILVEPKNFNVWVDSDISYDLVNELEDKLGVCPDVATRLLLGKDKLSENCYCMDNKLIHCKDKDSLVKKLQTELDEWMSDCEYHEEVKEYVEDFKDDLQMVIANGKLVKIEKLKFKTTPPVTPKVKLNI